MNSEADQFCPNCDSDDVRIDFVDLESGAFGLPNVILKNSIQITCLDCDAIIRELPKAGMLIDRVRRAVCWLGRALTGQEIAFLRQSLGYTGKSFAATINKTNVSVSRWENGNQGIPKSVELLLRAITLSELGQAPNLSKIVEEIANSDLIDIEIDLREFVESTNKIHSFSVPNAVPIQTGILAGSDEFDFTNEVAIEVAFNG